MGDRIHIKSEKQLHDLAGYTKDIKPEDEPQLRIIGHYYLTPMIQCGIKSCHQKHNEGVVLALSDGRVTNVGHICGERFGDRFRTAFKTYSDQHIRPPAIQKLAELKTRLATMQMALHDMRTKTNQLCERIQAFRERFPRVAQELVRRANSGNDRVFESVPLTNAEVDNLVAANPGSRREQFRYREELRGRIAGLKLFAIKLRDQIVTGFVDKAEQLRDADIPALSTERLLNWDNWAEDFDRRFDEASALLALGTEFFSRGNLDLLAYLAVGNDQAEGLRKLTVDNLFKSTTAKAATGTPVGFAETKPEKAARKRMEALQKLSGRR